MKSMRSCYLIFDTSAKLYLAIPTSNKTWTDDLAHIKFYTSEAHAKKAASRLSGNSNVVILPSKLTVEVSDSLLSNIAKATISEDSSGYEHLNEVLHD